VECGHSNGGGGGGVRCNIKLKSPLEHYPNPSKGQGNGQYIVGTQFVMGGLIEICADTWFLCILYTYVFGSKKNQ
jgi:hypothetical protein